MLFGFLFSVIISMYLIMAAMSSRTYVGQLEVPLKPFFNIPVAEVLDII